MSFIRTIQGDIEPKMLGFTYSHEHIVCRPPYWVEKQADDLLLDDEHKSKLDVLDFKNAGGKTIVDATAVDYGRDVEAVKRIADQTGVKIVGSISISVSICMGAELYEQVKNVVVKNRTYYGCVDNASINELTCFVYRDIEEGLEGMNILGGQVKIVTGY